MHQNDNAALSALRELSRRVRDEEETPGSWMRPVAVPSAVVAHGASAEAIMGPRAGRWLWRVLGPNGRTKTKWATVGEIDGTLNREASLQRRGMERRSLPHFVYLAERIVDGQLAAYKIGASHDLAARLVGLSHEKRPCGAGINRMVYAIELADWREAYEREQELHRVHFAEYRSPPGREWYRPDPEVRAIFARLTDGMPELER